GLDGVMAKSWNGPYVPGKRFWVKIKHQRTADCVVIGWRKSSDGSTLGALLLGLYDKKGTMHYVGHTSSFNAGEGKDASAGAKPRMRDGFDQIAAAAQFVVRGIFGSTWQRARARPARPVIPDRGAAEPRHGEPVEARSGSDPDPEGNDARRQLGSARGGKAHQDARDEPARAMDQQHAWDTAERGQRQALATGDQDVLPQLQRAAGQADHDEGLEHSVLRSAQLVAEDHRDAEHELDLLLERVQGLARDRADGEHGPESGGDRRRATQCAGRGHASPRGTDELARKLITRIERVSRTQPSDLGSDRGFAALYCLVEGFEDETKLRRELVEVHGAETTAVWVRAKKSHQQQPALNTQLRLCRDKA